MICNTNPLITSPVELGRNGALSKLSGRTEDRFKLNSHGRLLCVSKNIVGVLMGWTGALLGSSAGSLLGSSAGVGKGREGVRGRERGGESHQI